MLRVNLKKFSQLIHDKFNIQKQNQRHCTDGYNATHVIVELEDVGDHDPLFGVKCEIQLTTILFHAWS